MKNEKLFRETPFGGYKRQDVLNYLETLEQNHKSNIDDLNERILELNNLLTEATRQQESMQKELEIKTEYAAQTEELKSELEEKDRQIEELIAACEEMGKQADAVAQRCNDLAAEMEKYRQGFACEKLQSGTCVAITEQADKLLAETEKTAQKRLSDAEERATGIILKARMEAEEILAEAQGQTDAIALKVSEEASEIIAMTVRESQGIIDSAKQQSNVILSDSARSIGKIKGNLSSMQMVVKNIENELRSAKETLADSIAKKEVQ